MPTSNLHVAPYALHLIWEVRPVDRPLRVLDVGPGWGKYAGLIREYVDPEARVVALETWEPYVKQFDLWSKYAYVAVGDVTAQSAWWLSAFDVVFMGDVIEHIDKEPALALLDRITTHIVVSTPRDFFHNPAGLPDPETHRSHWTLDEVRAHPRFDGYSPEALERYGGLVFRLRST